MVYSGNPDEFLKSTKFPQILIPTNDGYFIDDDDVFIQAANGAGFPDSKLVKIDINNDKEFVLDIARKIASDE